MKSCGRCNGRPGDRVWLVQAGYSLDCGNCGGIGVVREDGSVVMPDDPEYAALAQASREFETEIRSRHEPSGSHPGS